MGPRQQYGYYGEQKKSGFNWKIILVILAGLILIIALIGGIVALSKQNGIGTQSQHLGARLTNLATLTTAARKQLKTDDMQKANAEAAIVTLGVQANLASILPKKVDKSVLATESDASTTTTLTNAALAGTYDTQYKLILTQKLESITALMREMTAKTNSRTVRDALRTDYANYQAILTRLQKP